MLLAGCCKCSCEDPSFALAAQIECARAACARILLACFSHVAQHLLPCEPQQLQQPMEEAHLLLLAAAPQSHVRRRVPLLTARARSCAVAAAAVMPLTLVLHGVDLWEVEVRWQQGQCQQGPVAQFWQHCCVG